VDRDQACGLRIRAVAEAFDDARRRQAHAATRQHLRQHQLARPRVAGIAGRDREFGAQLLLRRHQAAAVRSGVIDAEDFFRRAFDPAEDAGDVGAVLGPVEPHEGAVADRQGDAAAAFAADSDRRRRLLRLPIERSRQGFALIAVDAGDLDHHDIRQPAARRIAPAARALDLAVARQLLEHRFQCDLGGPLDAEGLGDFALPDFARAAADEVEDFALRREARLHSPLRSRALIHL
jgi:hypothetical protein